MKKPLKTIFCLTMALMMLLPPSGSGFAARPEQQNAQTVRLAVISDPHILPQSLINPNSQDFKNIAHLNTKMTGESEAIIKAALATIQARKAAGTFDADYLIIPGDLTYNGEKPGHVRMKEMLSAFEAATGVEVFVINGNHDINNPGAAHFLSPSGKRVTARQDPDLLFTTPEFFKSNYADFGYAQADSFYINPSGKVGTMSYAVTLKGGYRLIALDSCVFSADATPNGEDDNDSTMALHEGLVDWALEECRKARENGQTVIGMAHGSLVEHFDFEPLVSDNSMIEQYEALSCRFADASMHFIFTGHVHSTDTASAVSARGETIYDLETGGLTTYPNTYREVTFTTQDGAVACHAGNVDCDAASPVDVSAMANGYSVIQKPFSEYYGKPMLFAGDIENGVPYNTSAFIYDIVKGRVPSAIRNALPNGISGLLEQSVDRWTGDLLAQYPELAAALKGFGMTPCMFTDFLKALISQIDEQFITNADSLDPVIGAAIERLSHFEFVEGDPETSFGDLVMLGLTENLRGNEDPAAYPQVDRCAASLRTQATADRFVEEIIDLLLNDVIFDYMLYRIDLIDLTGTLPSSTISKLRAAGDGVTAGDALDAILDTAAAAMNRIGVFAVDDGRDLAKAFIYAAGAAYIGPEGRRKITCALADIVDSFTQDSNPSFKGDFDTVYLYNGKTTVKPTAENYRLPNGLAASYDNTLKTLTFRWNTMPGIEGTDLVAQEGDAPPVIDTQIKNTTVAVPMIDLGFYTMAKPRSVVEHTLAAGPVEKGKLYVLRAGDASMGLMSDAFTLTVRPDNSVQIGKPDKPAYSFRQFFADINAFFVRIIAFFKTFWFLF